MQSLQYFFVCLYLIIIIIGGWGEGLMLAKTILLVALVPAFAKTILLLALVPAFCGMYTIQEANLQRLLFQKKNYRYIPQNK